MKGRIITKKKTRNILLCTAIPAFIVANLVLYHSFASKNNDETTASAPHADWVDHYSNVDSLIEASDVIIRGKVVGSSTEQRVDMIFTKETIEPSIIYKGSLEKGDIIEVLQTGGEMNNIKTEPFEEAPLLDIDGSYLLFLRRSDEGHYLILGGYQGVGKIDNNKIIFNKENVEIAREFKNKSFNVVESLLAEKVIVKHN